MQEWLILTFLVSDGFLSFFACNVETEMGMKLKNQMQNVVAGWHLQCSKQSGVESLFRNIPKMRTSPLIKTLCMVPAT